MNIGQVLEVHLGMAAKALGLHLATPVFDGASEQDILDMLQRADEASEMKYPLSGKFTVRDGRTGLPFDPYPNGLPIPDRYSYGMAPLMDLTQFQPVFHLPKMAYHTQARYGTRHLYFHDGLPFCPLEKFFSSVQYNNVLPDLHLEKDRRHSPL